MANITNKDLKYILGHVLNNYLNVKHKAENKSNKYKLINKNLKVKLSKSEYKSKKKKLNFKNYARKLNLDKNHFRISNQDKTDKAKSNKIHEKNIIFKNSIGDLHVECSAGNGNWAAVPWIRVFNTSIAPSPEKGLYIVYLFSNKMRHVYLSLAEGVTEFNSEHGKKKISSLKNYSNQLNSIVYNIINNNKDISSSIISNGMNKRILPGHKKAKLLDVPIKSPELPKEYSAGGILNVEYSLDKINSPKNLNNLTNSKLLKDLNIMCKIYNKILLQSHVKNVHKRSKKIEIKNKYNFTGIPLILNTKSINTTTDPVHRNLQPNTNKKPNYNKKHKINSLEGKGGEKLVVQHEINKLKKAGHSNLAKHVIWEAQVNDRAGYDVRSFTTKCQELYIEVKTTPNQSVTTPFHISWRELGIAKRYPSKFRLYRIYKAKKRNNDPKKNKFGLKIYNYNDLTKIVKLPESYMMYPKHTYPNTNKPKN